MKRSQVQDFVTNTLGQLHPVNFLSMYPHIAVPGHNLHTELPSDFENSTDKLDTASEMFKTKVAFTHPLPAFYPSRMSQSALNGNDPCLNLVAKKRKFNTYKTRLLKNCHENMIPEFAESDDENRKLPKCFTAHANFVNLAQLIENDPDPYFDSAYNWYYTGGNIDICVINGQSYLIRPERSQINRNILLSKIPERNFMSDEIVEHNIMTKNDEIFQIDSHNNRAIVRHKNTCTLLDIDEYPNGINVHQINAESSTPFISCSINKENPNSFCTLSLNREITIWMTDGSNIAADSLTCDGVDHKDSWGQVYYVDENTIAYMDRKSMNIIDLRTHMHGIGSLHFPINDFTEICEEIFCGAAGHIGLHYVAATHQLLALDVRKGWTQRWTHGVCPTPYLMDIDHNRSQDLIVLGCQTGDSIVYIENHKQKTTNFSPMQPYFVPSMLETLNKARCEDLCLDYALDSRFTSSLIGLCCFKDEGFKIFRSMSSGDVFMQEKCDLSTYLENEDFNQSEISILTFYEDECDKIFMDNITPLPINALKSSLHFLEDMDLDDKDLVGEKKEPNLRGPWRKSKKSLLQYRDYLAPKLLKVWDIENEEEWCSEDLDEDSDLSVSESELETNEKVREWFKVYQEDGKDEDKKVAVGELTQVTKNDF